MSNKEKSIPLSRLRLSPLNMRKTYRKADIRGLAADIAAKDLLENLVVNKTEGEHYEVVAGGRRLAALQYLAKKRKITKNYPVRCLIVAADETGAALVEISLSENFQRLDPHPADQFQAFARLKAAGLSVTDIGTRFGITKTFVEQRLKLAAISPRILAEYRKDRMTLEQVVAFTLSDDHALQEEIWFDQPYTEIEPAFIRRRLTGAQVEATDRRALFIGAKAYEAAGGNTLRDLFDTDGEGYLTDSPLLDRLVAEKLETISERYRKEGWSWVDVLPETNFAHLSEFGHIAPTEGVLSKKDEKRLQTLSTRYDDLVSRVESDEDPAVIAELDTVEAELKTLQAKKEIWSDADKAKSGVVISLDQDGAVNIARGLVREHSQPDGVAKIKPSRTGFPDAVLRDLAAHRTAALREVLADRPAVAHLALLEALVSMSFHGGLSGCLQVTAREIRFDHLSDSVGESPAAKAFFARRQKWASKIPEASGLWSWLQTLDRKARDELMALCVAMTADALYGRDEEATPLSELLGLDMHAWWKPSDALLVRLSKTDILAAVAQVISPEAARKLTDMKKPAMAEHAAALLSGAGWLPDILRLPPVAALAAE